MSGYVKLVKQFQRYGMNTYGAGVKTRVFSFFQDQAGNIAVLQAATQEKPDRTSACDYHLVFLLQLIHDDSSAAAGKGRAAEHPTRAVLSVLVHLRYSCV